MNSNSEPFGEGLVIVKASEKDADEMLEFINEDFCKHEPLTTALQATPEECEPLFRDLIKLSLTEPCITYIVRSSVTNEIAGIRMAAIINRPDLDEDHPPQYPSWKANAIEKLIQALELEAWKVKPEAQKLATWIILSVNSKFQRRGIAQHLIEYRIDEIKAAGGEGIITEATAFKSQQLFQKLGYQSLKEILHADYKENDKQIFKCLDQTDRAVLCYKPL